MLDLDYFKKINDTHGHQAGDEMLISIVDQVGFHLRETDLSGRWGGEEFIVLLADADETTACFIAERIRLAIEEMTVNLVNGRSEENVKVTVSIGVSERKKSNSSELSVQIKKADQALYTAKKTGRNQVSVFSH
jgi:diguanylate cyclase (GGDEF)-like protein